MPSLPETSRSVEISLKENSLAKRYAASLIKALQDDHQYQTIKQELEQFLQLLHTIAPLKAGMETLLFSNTQKMEVLNAIHEKIQFTDKTYRFLAVILEENRLPYLAAIIEVLEVLWLEKNGIEKLKVFSAVPLSAELEQKLVLNLEKALDKKVILDKEIDPTLIAGIKIQKGLVYYDFSIEGNLKKLKQALLSDVSTTPGRMMAGASAREH